MTIQSRKRTHEQSINRINTTNSHLLVRQQHNFKSCHHHSLFTVRNKGYRKWACVMFQPPEIRCRFIVRLKWRSSVCSRVIRKFDNSFHCDSPLLVACRQSAVQWSDFKLFEGIYPLTWLTLQFEPRHPTTADTKLYFLLTATRRAEQCNRLWGSEFLGQNTFTSVYA
jgi:hypothetical protein